MSKSLKNVVNPDDVVKKYGADSLRLYEMFMGPLDVIKPWADNGVKGVYGFLGRVCRFFGTPENITGGVEDMTVLKGLHQTIKKVGQDIENLRFNTAISQMMIFTNLCIKKGSVTRETAETFFRVLSPFAPHLAEELWEKSGNQPSISRQTFPESNDKYLQEDSFEYPVSFNGKLRFHIELPLTMSKEDIEKAVLNDEKATKWLDGKTPEKVIVVPGKIVNVVI